MHLFVTKFNTKDNRCYTQRKFCIVYLLEPFRKKEGNPLCPKDPDEIQLTYSITNSIKN